MLCSGSIMGSREEIMSYLDTIQKKMTNWMTKPNCQLDMRGDDQSIHNYLYYTHQLKIAKAIPHWTGAMAAPLSSTDLLILVAILGYLVRAASAPLMYSRWKEKP